MKEQAIHIDEMDCKVLRCIGRFLTTKEIFSVLRIVCRKFSCIFGHDLQVNDPVLLTRNRKKRHYRRTLRLYPTIQWRTGYCKGSLDQIKWLRFKRLMMYYAGYDFQEELDVYDGWGFDNFPKDKNLCGTNYDLNHLVLVGNYDLELVPALPYLRSLNTYKAGNFYPCNVKLPPLKFPALHTLKLTVDHLDAELLHNLKQMTQLSALYLTPENPSPTALVCEFFQVVSPYLVKFGNFFTDHDLEKYHSQEVKVEWPRLEVLHACVDFPLPRCTRDGGLSILYLDCRSRPLQKVLKTIAGHVFAKLVLEDLIIDLDEYEQGYNTEQWVSVLNDAKCSELVLRNDKTSTIRDSAVRLYIWQSIFFHPKSKLKKLSCVLNNFTIVKEGNGKFGIFGSL